MRVIRITYTQEAAKNQARLRESVRQVKRVGPGDARMSTISQVRCDSDCYRTKALLMKAFPGEAHKLANDLLASLIADLGDPDCIKKVEAAKLLMRVFRKPLFAGRKEKINMFQWVGREAVNRTPILGPQRAQWHTDAARLAETMLDRILRRDRWDPDREDAAPLPWFVGRFLAKEIVHHVRGDRVHRLPDAVLEGHIFFTDNIYAAHLLAEEEEPRPQPSKVQLLAMEVQVAEHLILKTVIPQLRGSLRHEPVWRQKLRRGLPAIVRLHHFDPELFQRRAREIDDSPGVESDSSPPGICLDDHMPLPHWHSLMVLAKAGKNSKQARETMAKSMVRIIDEVGAQALLEDVFELRRRMCDEIEARLIAQMRKFERVTAKLAILEQQIRDRTTLYRCPFLLIEPR